MYRAIYVHNIQIKKYDLVEWDIVPLPGFPFLYSEPNHL